MKPILFNTEMVRAILDGRKTVTRRVVKLPSYVGVQANGLYELYTEGTCYRDQHFEDITGYLKAPYKVNDILYVRETWREHIRPLGSPKSYGYRAATDDRVACLFNWKPSIHMPKEAARIFLKVTGVRVERLQDITEEQAKAEGVKNPYSYAENDDYWETTGRNELSADVAAFSALWDSTVHKSNIDHYGWDANPYVCVIEFEVIDKAAALKEGQA